MAAIHHDCYKLDEWLIREKGIGKEECETLSKRLVHFAHSFCKQFEDKICAYFDEATGISFKKSKTTEFLIGAFAGALGGAATYAAGLGTSGFKPTQTSGQKAYEFMANKPREKVIKRTLKIQKLVNETNIQKLFIKIATNLFITHQQQLMKFIDDEDWLTNVERLVEDAVRIILSYLEEYEKDKKLKFESMALMAFLTNKSKTFSKKDLIFEKSKGAIKKVGRESKRLIKWEKKHWTFERFSAGKCGFVAKINEEVKYFWTPNLSPPKYGFKLIPRAILDLLIDEKEKLHITQEYKPEVHYNYLMMELDDELDAIVDLIKEIIANCATGINKDMHREMIDLRRDLKAIGITKENEEDSKQKEKRNEVKSEEILSPVASFIGRKNELKAIHEKLNSDEESQGRISHAVCVCGLGGMGKTELARKYVEIHRQEFEKVYWINADNITYDAQAIKDFYEKNININTSSKNKILIVLDNAHRFEDVVPFFPKTRKNNLFFLITSRSKNWDAQQEGEIRLVELTTFEEARELIEKKLPEEKKEDVNKLIVIVGSLPLALQQAISFIANKQKKQITLKGKSNYKIQNYVKEFKKNSKAFLDGKFDKVRYLQTVYTTWNITFQQIEQDEEQGKQAIEIMRIIAYLRPDFYVSFLTEDIGFDEDAILLLNRYSLINLTSVEYDDERLASVHRLVQEVIRMQMQEKFSSIADCNNLEETILSQIIELENVFYRANEDFWERLQDEKYTHIFKDYCKKISQLEKIHLYNIIRTGKKVFETMWTKKYLNWQDENVKQAIGKHIKIILGYCDVNIACEILNELENENAIFESHSCIKTECEQEEMKQQKFKLIALLCNSEEKSKEALLSHLSQFQDENLQEILKMRCAYARKLEFSFINDLLKLAIDKNHPGILSNYLLKHLKQDGTLHLEFAIKWRKENAFCELANKEYLEENKNILNVWKGLNIFDYAYANGTLTMVKHLESVGFKNTTDLTFNLPFYKTCNFEVFEYAFCNGAINAERKDSLGRSALFYAARVGRFDLFEFLICSSEKCFAIDLENEEDKKGNTLLHYALSECDMDNWQDDVDKDYIFSNGWEVPPKDLSLIKVLLNAGVADPSKANVYGQTAFMLAAYWYDEEAIECLLPTTDSAALSLIINQRCCDGRTALHYAAMRGQYEEITNFTSTLNTQFPTIPMFSLRTLFIISENAKSKEILLKFGADANEEDNCGCLPLHYASMTFESLTVCELFGFKWEEWPSHKDRQENTPLIYAAVACNIPLLLELSKIDEANGYSLNLSTNMCNKQNRNLFHLLAICVRGDYHGYKDVIDWLLNKKQLDLSAKDVFGHTPMDYARERNNQEFIKAIKEVNQSI